MTLHYTVLTINVQYLVSDDTVHYNKHEIGLKLRFGLIML
jgi:hypothetical protein